MFKITNMKSSLIKVASRSKLLIQKRSPEILMVTGIVSIVGGTVLACRATLKAESVLDEAKEKFDKINEAHENTELVESGKYTEQDYKRDTVVAYVQTGAEFGKLYGPSALAITIGIGCILMSYNIMRKRNLALAAAYTLIDNSFKSYRKRVIDEYGKDKDFQYRNGIYETTEQETIVGKNGKEKVVDTPVLAFNSNSVSPYARFFDECSNQWDKNPEYNLMYLKGKQNHANDLLNVRGHVFLNEVYDMLGIPRTQEGALVGWVKGNGGDDFIDFNMYDMNGYHPEAKRNFINGYEKSILLDFNVDGIIYNLI